MKRGDLDTDMYTKKTAVYKEEEKPGTDSSLKALGRNQPCQQPGFCISSYQDSETISCCHLVPSVVLCHGSPGKLTHRVCSDICTSIPDTNHLCLFLLSLFVFVNFKFLKNNYSIHFLYWFSAFSFMDFCPYFFFCLL